MSLLLATVVAAALPAAGAPEVTRIRSDSAEYDRAAGVVVFSGRVSIEHAGEYTMNADKIYAVMSASNELGRVVATGGVAITNGVRRGECAMAIYKRAKREIEMLGDAKGRRARLVDAGDRPAEMEGDRVRFWLDSEQVEVENSRITTGSDRGGDLL